MNAQTFIQNFGHVASAPNGIQSIRQLVMASALAGHFSAPNDKLSEDIHYQIQAARVSYLNKAGRREKPLMFGAPLIQEFPIPPGWQWVRVGQVCDLQTGATPSRQRSDYFGGDIRWLVSGDINQGEIFDCSGRITQAGLENSNCKILPKHSVLIALNGQGKTRATVALLRVPAACNQSLVAMIPFSPEIIAPEFLFLALRYRYFEIRDITGQDQRRGLNMGLVSELSVPLAPLPEQKRILAKVNELMALCDRLEARQQERQKLFPLLSQASHERFTEAPNNANLDRIFDQIGCVSPADLRKSILTLGVQGKLVRQNPSDAPPAIAMFPKLASAAAQTSDELLPPRWLRVPLGKIGEWRGGGTPSKSRPEYWEGKIPWVSPKDMKLLGISDAQDHISEAAVADSAVRMIPPGSLLMVVRGMILARAFPVALTTQEVTINQDMKALLPFEPATADYLLVALRAFEPDVLAAIERSTHGTCKLETKFLQNFMIPLPPLAEQRRIVTKVGQLLALVDVLENLKHERDRLAEVFAKATVASLTGTHFEERKLKMKAPKTELISTLKLGTKPKATDHAPLAAVLAKAKGEMPAKSLWQQSGLSIDDFYQQLKKELAHGWIAPPQPAEMKIVEDQPPRESKSRSAAEGRRRIDL